MYAYYKRNPSNSNKNLQQVACRQMEATSRWAKRRWEADLCIKLSSSGVDSKT